MEQTGIHLLSLPYNYIKKSAVFTINLDLYYINSPLQQLEQYFRYD